MDEKNYFKSLYAAKASMSHLLLREEVGGPVDLVGHVAVTDYSCIQHLCDKAVSLRSH